MHNIKIKILTHNNNELEMASYKIKEVERIADQEWKMKHCKYITVVNASNYRFCDIRATCKRVILLLLSQMLPKVPEMVHRW
jgi:hypothetical protein